MGERKPDVTLLLGQELVEQFLYGKWSLEA